MTCHLLHAMSLLPCATPPLLCVMSLQFLQLFHDLSPLPKALLTLYKSFHHSLNSFHCSFILFHYQIKQTFTYSSTFHTPSSPFTTFVTSPSHQTLSHFPQTYEKSYIVKRRSTKLIHQITLFIMTIITSSLFKLSSKHPVTFPSTLSPLH
jgi:hypothetical protein